MHSSENTGGLELGRLEKKQGRIQVFVWLIPIGHQTKH